MWRLQKFNPDKREWELVDEFDYPADCFGDDLYELMEENGYIETINDYNVDGDSEYIAVMPRRNGLDEFQLVFYNTKEEAKLP